MAKTKSFYQQRMDLLEVTKDNNQFWVSNPDAEHPEPSRREIDIFEQDRDGNIKINFWTLQRQQINYVKMGNGKMSHINGKRMVWFQTRFKSPKDGYKYHIPAGQGTHPFLPPAVVEAWEKKEAIETLFLTEGAFKAWYATQKGAMTIGLTSITHYRDKETQRLHRAIELIIKDCKVKNVVILWDGDCLDISESQLFDKEDISNRPFGFFNSAKKIRELIEEIPKEEVAYKIRIYYYHVKTECLPERPKGLDDLLLAAKKGDRVGSVIQEMHKVGDRESFFFCKQNITSGTHTLFKYFRLHNEDFFYHLHSDTIKLNEFVFKGNIYQYEEGKNKLELISPEWAKNVKWIGDDFFKIVEKPMANGDTVQVLEKRKKQTILDLYGKDFQKYIKYYEGFCNVPDHFNYKQVHGQFYNRYSSFRWTPAPGAIHTTMDFIKHIFGDKPIKHKKKTYRSWEIGLDYLQLLITKPTQILPVIVLFSPENNTGKSTLGKWEKAILGNNCIQIGNQDFKSEFNDHWTDKCLSICEETLLDRKKDVELIKAYATSTKVMVNPKGFGKFEIDFFCKFQFYSNNHRMIYVTKHDERFWILKVRKPKKDNPNILDELIAEIPAFLHHILNRQLVTQKESRMWFHASLIRTETFYDTVKVNEPTEARNLREKIKEMFLDFGQEDILMPIGSIEDEFWGGKKSVSWTKELLRDYLNVDQLRDSNGKLKQIRGKYFKWVKDYNEDGSESAKIKEVRFHGRPYVFHRADFVPEDEDVDRVAEENCDSAWMD